MGMKCFLEIRNVMGSGDMTTCTRTSASVGTRALDSMSVGSLASVCTTAMLDGIEDAAESSNASAERLKKFMDTSNKLSPKVYCGVTKPMVHSLEDINSNLQHVRPFCHTYSGKSDKPRPWGSLQEIRNLGSCASDKYLVRFSFIYLCNISSNVALFEILTV